MENQILDLALDDVAIVDKIDESIIQNDSINYENAEKIYNQLYNSKFEDRIKLNGVLTYLFKKLSQYNIETFINCCRENYTDADDESKVNKEHLANTINSINDKNIAAGADFIQETMFCMTQGNKTFKQKIMLISMAFMYFGVSGFMPKLLWV
jgi:hypothetical protein